MKEEYQWGETRWDSMTPDELKRECQRMYSALISANSIISMSKAMGGDNPYWGHNGLGGKALEKARQALYQEENDNSEPMYRVFFRYADDLLFDCSKYDIGSEWHVCDTCGAMWGVGKRGESMVGLTCEGHFGGKPGCAGTVRKLQWSDLKPVQPEIVDVKPD